MLRSDQRQLRLLLLLTFIRGPLFIRSPRTFASIRGATRFARSAAPTRDRWAPPSERRAAPALSRSR
jgi:hypothetical protein